jgi:hypothetical protein
MKKLIKKSSKEIFKKIALSDEELKKIAKKKKCSGIRYKKSYI